MEVSFAELPLEVRQLIVEHITANCKRVLSRGAFALAEPFGPKFDGEAAAADAAELAASLDCSIPSETITELKALWRDSTQRLQAVFNDFVLDKTLLPIRQHQQRWRAVYQVYEDEFEEKIAIACKHGEPDQLDWPLRAFRDKAIFIAGSNGALLCGWHMALHVASIRCWEACCPFCARLVTMMGPLQ